MKKSRIASILLLIIACAIEVFCVISYVDCVRLIVSQSIGALAIIALLPMYFIGTFAIMIISIILSVIYKNSCNKMVETGFQKPRFDKFYNIVSWLFFVANIVLFISFYFY